VVSNIRNINWNAVCEIVLLLLVWLIYDLQEKGFQVCSIC